MPHAPACAVPRRPEEARWIWQRVVEFSGLAPVPAQCAEPPAPWRLRGEVGALLRRSEHPDRACSATRLPLSRGSRPRSEEHTSELQSLMRISYAVFCLKKKQDRRNIFQIN